MESPTTPIEPPEDDLRNERITRLGRAQTEPEAFIIAAELEAEGLRVMVTGMPTIGMVFPGSSQFSVDIMVLERDYEKAREVFEAMPTRSRAVDSLGRCVLCRYDLSGIESPVCPECGQDLEQLGKRNRTFRLDPPPADSLMIQKLGALIGSLTLIPLVVVILILVGMLIVGGVSGWLEVLTGSGG